MGEHLIKFGNEKTRETVQVILYSVSILGMVAIFLMLLLQ